MRLLMLILILLPFSCWAQDVERELAEEEIEDVMHSLITDLLGDDPELAHRAEERLIRSQDLAYPHLVRALRTRLGHGVARIAHCIGLLGNAEAIPVLKKQLRGSDIVRFAVATALCRLGDKSGIPVFIALLESDDRQLRLRACAYLRRFTHQYFGFFFEGTAGTRGRALRRWRDWWKREGETFELQLGQNEPSKRTRLDAILFAARKKPGAQEAEEKRSGEKENDSLKHVDTSGA